MKTSRMPQRRPSGVTLPGVMQVKRVGHALAGQVNQRPNFVQIGLMFIVFIAS
jgi:hypothetical protein